MVAFTLLLHTEPEEVNAITFSTLTEAKEINFDVVKEALSPLSGMLAFLVVSWILIVLVFLTATIVSVCRCCCQGCGGGPSTVDCDTPEYIWSRNKYSLSLLVVSVPMLTCPSFSTPT